MTHRLEVCKWCWENGSQDGHRPSVYNTCGIWDVHGIRCACTVETGFCLFLWCGCEEGNILKLKMFELFEKNNEIFLSGSYPTNTVSSVRWTASELSACLCRRCEWV